MKQEEEEEEEEQKEVHPSEKVGRFEMNTEMVDVPWSEHTGQADHRDAEPQSDATVMPDQQLAATLGHSSPLGVDAEY